MDGRVAALWRYPVSSLGGERLEACAVDASGLVGDREWGLADRDSGETAIPESKRRWRPAPEIGARSAADGLHLDFPDGRSLPAEGAGNALAAHFGFPVALRLHHHRPGRPAAGPRRADGDHEAQRHPFRRAVHGRGAGRDPVRVLG